MPLAPTHPIWSSHALVPASVFQGEQVPAEKKIQAIERGCKTVVVFSPQPLAGYWEENRFSPKVGEVVGERDRAKLAYRLAGNIIAYATGLEPPKPRLDRPKILDPKEDKAAAGARYLIELAQVKHDGGDWQPAKNALRALAAERPRQVPDRRGPGQAGRADDASRRSCGRTSSCTCTARGSSRPRRPRSRTCGPTWTRAATLLADACCGAEPFDQAFREFAKKLYPDKKLEVIPADDLLYSEKLNGEAITPAALPDGKGGRTPPEGGPFKDMPPMLEGIKVDGRWAVIYSRYDIGCALEKNKSSACKGYDPESAMRLATAALLYALKR